MNISGDGLAAPISVAPGAVAPGGCKHRAYGPAYADAAPALTVLSFTFLLMSMPHHAGDLFKARGDLGILVLFGTGKAIY